MYADNPAVSQLVQLLDEVGAEHLYVVLAIYLEGEVLVDDEQISSERRHPGPRGDATATQGP